MSYTNHLAAAALAALFAATPLAGQTRQPDRFLVVGVYGGSYDHTINLSDPGPAHGTADFTRGHSFGATAGVQLNRFVALHGDFTYVRNEAVGDESFTGRSFDRFFYGAHIEVGYPLPGGVAPYLFLGGGAVTIDELGSAATISPFTKPAAMFGMGFSYPIAGRFGLFAEGKELFYQWDRGGFAPTTSYIPTTAGQTYRVDESAGRFDRTQWDLTYTFGVSYRFKTRTRQVTPAATPSDQPSDQ